VVAAAKLAKEKLLPEKPTALEELKEEKESPQDWPPWTSTG
jgi:hypothetical protein